MSCDDTNQVISVSSISKTYRIWRKPSSRLMVPLMHRLASVVPNDSFGRYINRCVEKQFEDFAALKSVNFNLLKGESIGIVGRNGSGKSTLLKIITGVLQPSSGRIRRKGRIAALLELGSGFDPNLPGIENIYMNASLLGVSRSEVDKKLESIVGFADIGDFINHPVKKYSSGMKMRLAFAVTTCLEPDVLIIDEALAVGDDSFKRKCYSRIEELKKRGCSLLFVSHSSSLVVQLCDRALLLESGEQLLFESPKKVIGLYQKFMNVPSGEREAVLEKIRHNELGNNDVPKAKGDQHLVAEYEDGSEEDRYDASLVPKSTIRFDSQGVAISNVRLLNSDGEKVNVVRRRKRYRLCYDTEFQDFCYSVRFSMLIKTIEGLGIGGMVSNSLGKGIEKVDKGKNFTTSFSFTCNLGPGTYFMNAGVKGIFEDKEIFLHRILDAYMFRVEDEGDLITSYVDFDMSIDLDQR